MAEQQLMVFVSHSHEDNVFCQTLVQALRLAGADVWYDEHNMGSGQLGPTIERELRVRPIFVVILSPAALHSRWVEDECRWSYGLARKDPARILLPLTADAIDEDDLWLFLRDFKRIEVPGGTPYPAHDAIRRTLYALGITPPDEANSTSKTQAAAPTIELTEPGADIQVPSSQVAIMPPAQHTADLSSQAAIPQVHSHPAPSDSGRVEGTTSPLQQDAIMQLPDSAADWMREGDGHYDLRAYGQAARAYDHARAIDSSLVAAWVGLGDAYYCLMRYGDAIAAYDHALALNPHLAAVWRDRGAAMFIVGSYVEAMASFTRAVDEDRHDFGTYALTNDIAAWWQSTARTQRQGKGLTTQQKADRDAIIRRIPRPQRPRQAV